MFIDEVKGSLGDRNDVVLDALLYRDITVLASDVTEVKSHTFANCEQLTNVEINQATTIGDYAFYNCSKLGDATYPLVETIGEHAFEGCVTMNRVNFPKAEIIGDYAFYNCTGFMNPRFSSVKHIGNYAFYNAGCGITSSETLPWWDTTKLEYIGDYCFYHDGVEGGWSKNLSFPALTHIGVYAFKYATISTIDIPLITHIPEGAFECTRLTSFSSANITSIGKKAFAEAYLETVSLSNVTTIDSEAFYKCTSLASIELPSVITISDRAFKECTKLKSICLPEATYLGSEALNTPASGNVNLLQHVDLHKVTKLHADVFGSPKRTGITKLILRNSDMVDVIISDTATELNVPLKTRGYIYVPTSLVSSYKADMYWSKYAAKFRALEDYTVDGTTTGELDETKI